MYMYIFLIHDITVFQKIAASMLNFLIFAAYNKYALQCNLPKTTVLLFDDIKSVIITRQSGWELWLA